jgi:hypothetical protein
MSASSTDRSDHIHFVVVVDLLALLLFSPLTFTTMRPLGPVDKQWLFTPDMLAHTPSRADGISLEQELLGRREAIMNLRSLWLRVGQ